jgi:WhiB family redox-sensing transcriptional regulator
LADIRHLPGPQAETWAWQLRGACRGAPSELFFHPEGERGAARARRELAAKEICGRCAVVAACLAHSLSAREPYGVWGGVGEDEREQLLTRPLTDPRLPTPSRPDHPAA